MLYLAAVAAAAVLSAAALVLPRSAAADTSHAVASLQEQNAALRRQIGVERRRHARLQAAATRRSVPTPGTVEHALTIAAETYGVPRERLRRVAVCESTLNPRAANGPYLGLFQFGLPLWNASPYRELPRTDPYAAALAAAKTFSEGGARHWPVCGR